MQIGVLALQGDFALHSRFIAALGHTPVEIRNRCRLDEFQGIIIPGGESTTLHLMLHSTGLWEPLTRALERGLPVWGTCAGAILLGHGSERPQPRLGTIDVEIVRNAYGRQVDSFVAPVQVSFLNDDFPGVFIRAPKIVNTGSKVEVMGKLESQPVMARQGSVLVTTFHPELTPDSRIHSYFIDHICTQSREDAGIVAG